MSGPTLLYDDMDTFLLNLPKLELHAHLNGSLCTNSIKELEQKLLQETGNAISNKSFNAKSMVLTNEKTMDEAFKKFAYMHHLTATPQGLDLATQLVIRDFVRDNVIYIELRSTPKSNAHMTRKEYLLCVLNAIQNAPEVKNGEIIVKLLPSFDRGKPVQEAAETLDAVLELYSEQYKNLIVGLDFSGNPAQGVFADFIPLLTKARAHGLPLALHCAEIENKEETEQMIDFGMRRCGHGTFLNQQQRETLAKQNVAIECCLSSNVECGTVPSYKDHHFKQIFNAKTPVVICTDDCGVFDTTLSQELLLASTTFNLHVGDIEKLTLDALAHAFISDRDEHKQLQQILLNHFDKNMLLPPWATAVIKK